MDRCWAEIDLRLIKNNIKMLRRSKNFMAVVKANGYGHGAVAVTRAALEAGATWLGVAIPEEGVELREAGFIAPILILSESSEIEHIVEYNLTPAVYTRRFIEGLPKGYPVHLKIDTGMHRVGCQPEEAQSMVNFIRDHGLRLQGLMTHLAGADDLTQLSKFDSLIDDLNLPSSTLIHAANSKAVLNGLGKYDMDRCGIAIYDGSMTLKSNVRLIQRVRAGEGVSYGWEHRFSETGDIGVVSIGYADGVSRKLIGTDVLIRGKRFSILSITMDQMILDLRSDVSVGDQVDLLVQEWPSRLNSLTYEVLCGIRKRVPRYYKNSE